MYKERMIGYYPKAIQDIREFQAIVDAEYPEFEEISTNKETIMDDAYLSTMQEDRIKQWEKFLKIVPLEDSTLEDRRNAIIAKMRGNNKLNTAAINSIVNAFTGGTATSYIQNSVLYVIINPPKTNKSFQFTDVERELSNRIPAHLGLNVSRIYYRWRDVKSNNDTWEDVNTNHSNWRDVYYQITNEGGT